VADIFIQMGALPIAPSVVSMLLHYWC